MSSRLGLVAGPGHGRRGLASLPSTQRGALIYLVAGIVFTATDSLTKTLVADLPVVHVLFGRHVSYLLAIVLIAGGRHPRRLLATRRPWVQASRGLAMFGATATYFLALSLLPMADAATLGSTAPLIVVALAGPLLGERVSRLAALGAGLGFAGVVVLVGLDSTKWTVAVAVPLLSSLSFALFSMLTRLLRDDPPEVTVFMSGLIGLGGAALLEIGLQPERTPAPLEWLAIGLLGLMALTGHRLLVAAYRWGRASDMAPLSYLQVVWSFIVGATAFGEPTRPSGLVGAAMVIAGGVVALRSTPADDPAPRERVIDGGPMDLPGG